MNVNEYYQKEDTMSWDLPQTKWRILSTVGHPYKSTSWVSFCQYSDMICGEQIGSSKG